VNDSGAGLGPMGALSAEQVTRYFADGFLFPVPGLEAAEAATYRSAAEDLRAFVAKLPSPTRVVQPHLHFRWAYELALHPRVLDAVESIIGGNILVHSTSIFTKEPRSSSFVSWHQDGFYWGLSEPRLVSAWIALSESTDGNGCLRVIPRTHLSQLPHGQRMGADNLLDSGLTVEANVRPEEAVDVVLKAGELSLHHAYLIHGSSANQSRTSRVGFAVRYVATDVAQKLPHHKVVLARGHDHHHHYQLLEQPPGHDVAAGVASQIELSYELLRVRGMA
jgi:non-heme Fe2+,alpha-ketoglutarate-dependent halogenase